MEVLADDIVAFGTGGKVELWQKGPNFTAQWESSWSGHHSRRTMI